MIRLIGLLILLIEAVGLCLCVNLDLNIDSSISYFNSSSKMFGIFFEEINHAGQGGLYAELIENRNFAKALNTTEPWTISHQNIMQLHLDTQYPLNKENTQNLRVSFSSISSDDEYKINNPGFHGIWVKQGSVYSFSLYFLVPSNSLSPLSHFVVSLIDPGQSLVYGSSIIPVPPPTNLSEYKYNHSQIDSDFTWIKLSTVLTSNGTGIVEASIQFIFSPQISEGGQSPIDLYLDFISLMSQDTFAGLPIRRDLGALVQKLAPSFVRFPGGCYVEGDILANRFNWKNSIGPAESRPGHYDLWGYVSEDGLGLFEYLSFIESLRNSNGDHALPIWVINSGNAHNDYVPVDQLKPYITDGLDSIEFAEGLESEGFGAIRAAMGHSDPFSVDYIAIGNEDCGKDGYLENYQAFYTAFHQAYPNKTLIANCNLSPLPTDLYDYHIYSSSTWFFENTHIFDSYNRSGPPVFVSEFAVTDDSGKGNLLAAIAEAAWMIGLERNSDIVKFASYAPLFVNVNDIHWNPSLIRFDAERAYGTPSYWAQLLFANAQKEIVPGSEMLISSSLSGSSALASDVEVVSSVSTLRAQGCRIERFIIVVKIVNGNLNNVTYDLNVKLNLFDENVKIITTGDLASLGGVSDNIGPSSENSFDNPLLIAPHYSKVLFNSTDPSNFHISVKPLSLNILTIYLA